MIRGTNMQEQTDYSDALCAARCIADHAVGEGILRTNIPIRPVYHHMGAVLADSIPVSYTHLTLPTNREV